MKYCRLKIGIVSLILWCGGAGLIQAQPSDSNEPSPVISPLNAQIPMAIMDFECKAPVAEELAHQIVDILTCRLSIHERFIMVERKKLESLLQEQQLSLMGLHDPAVGAKVGRLLGAKIMIFGRAFPVDRDLFMVAKIVGVETGQVKGVIVKGTLEDPLSDIIDKLVAELVRGLNTWTNDLLGKDQVAPPPIENLREKLRRQSLPIIGVVLSGAAETSRVAETEILSVLSELGFQVAVGEKESAAATVSLRIDGKAWSESCGQFQSLVGQWAHVDLQVMDVPGQKVFFAGQSSQRGADLSESLAAKLMIRKAARELALQLAEKIAQRKP